jgi:hypothetical protein
MNYVSNFVHNMRKQETKLAEYLKLPVKERP